jgi:hypothetical protein
MTAPKLSAASLTKLRKTPGRYGDGGGLFLEVGANGAASWLVRMQKAGKRRDFGLGSVDKVSLADARKARDVVRGQFEAGLDPVLERKKAEGVPTPACRRDRPQGAIEGLEQGQASRAMDQHARNLCLPRHR